MRIVSLIFVLIFQSLITCYAQKVEGDALFKKQALSTPEYYKTPDGTVMMKNAKRIGTGDGVVWYVFSDRENNQTFLDKNCTKPFTKINFKQVFLVADETDNQIRLVKFDPTETPYDEGKKGVALFNKKAEDMGWINKKNMLLWNNSLVDTSTKYSKKAISVKKPDESGNIANLIKKGILDFYDHPGADPQYDNGKDIGLFKYFFVMKEDKENKTYLLSEVNSVNRFDIDNNIWGWAKASQIHVWDNALCLRINFDDAAVQERKDMNVDVKFFRTPEDAKNYRDGLPCKPLLFLYSDPDKDKEVSPKDNPYLLGYPIIDNVPGESAIFKTGYVTNTVDSKGNSIFSATQQAKFDQVWEDLQKQKQNVNIVFVLDGNNRNFFRAIQTALNDNMIIGSGVQGANQYKLGAVIYNDNSCGEERIQRISKTSNKDDFLERLIDKQTPPPCTINRESNGAPLYEAIKTACNQFDDNKSTNILIMTGTASDPDASMKAGALNELIKKVAIIIFYQL